MIIKKLHKAFFVLLILTACRTSNQPIELSQYNDNTDLPQLTPILSPTSTPGVIPSAASSETSTVGSLECQLPPLIVPTLPAEIPGYTMLNSSTDLHMTGTYQQIDLASYQL